MGAINSPTFLIKALPSLSLRFLIYEMWYWTRLWLGSLPALKAEGENAGWPTLCSQWLLSGECVVSLLCYLHTKHWSCGLWGSGRKSLSRLSRPLGVDTGLSLGADHGCLFYLRFWRKKHFLVRFCHLTFSKNNSSGQGHFWSPLWGFPFRSHSSALRHIFN